MKKAHFLPLLLLASLPFLAGCDAQPHDHGDQELITRVRLVLSAQGQPNVVAEWLDTDGPGGAAPTVSGLNLQAGVTYAGTLELTDTINGEDISAEIAAKRETHQFFFTPGGDVASRMTVTRTDAPDGAGKPVGLTFSVATTGTAAATGTLRVELFHYDRAQDKQADSRAGGETDVDVTFPVTLRAAN